MKSAFLALSGLFHDEEIPAADIIDMSDIEGTCCYCDASAAEELRGRIAGLPLDAIHWIDTGDYHYMTLLFMERIQEPFELLLFDHHSDRQPMAFESPEMLSCGSWVTRALDSLPCLKNVMTVGTDDGSQLLAAGDAPVKGHGRPWPLYLSIDLDILSEEEFVTDWDQGEMTFEELCDGIARLTAGRRILGIDVCGGITCSKGAKGSDLTRNAALRKRFGEFLKKLTQSE